ncbi:MAG TPA: GNAT family N-acetyltransferase [Puia sp.]|nr:GNAT family N-acetyltransferase [Puia sp.]
MHSPHHIRYLRRQDIDDKIWDACIQSSPGGLIYGKTFFLDGMTAGRWDALVLGDYEIVMPLVWKKKWGIRYLYQPAFTQQLGLFAAAPIPAHVIEAFLEETERRYKFAEIFLNHRNMLPGLKPFVNLVLDLHRSYDELVTGYTQKLRYDLKKAGRSSLRYIQDPSLPDTLSVLRQHYSSQLPHLSAEDHDRFGTLCGTLQKKGQLLLRAITDDSGQLLATVLLPRDGKRLYLLQSTVSAAGRGVSANHFLMDRLICEWAGQPLTLDFEGTEQPGIAHFYRSFGAQDQPYFFYRNNRLPWPLRYLKPASAGSTAGG